MGQCLRFLCRRIRQRHNARRGGAQFSNLYNYDNYVGYNPGSSGTVTVTGTGSSWANKGRLYVGFASGGDFRCFPGGTSTSYVGYNTGGLGTLTVTGTGSRWTNTGDLYLGVRGSGTLTVADGGAVSTNMLYASRTDLLGNGAIATKVAVLDADFVFEGSQSTSGFGTGGTMTIAPDTNSRLGVGYKSGGTVRIINGATVSSQQGYVGYNAATTGTATVGGAGSKWVNTAYFMSASPAAGR